MSKFAFFRFKSNNLLTLEEEAFKQDPIGQEDNLDRALGLMQSFVQNVTPELKTNDSRISVSNVFSAIDIDENKL